MVEPISISRTEQIAWCVAFIIWIGISAICLISMLKNGSDEPIMIFTYVSVSVLIGLMSSVIITFYLCLLYEYVIKPYCVKQTTQDVV